MKGGFTGTEELLTLVPHKERMFLLSRLTAWDTEERTITSECDIRADGIFFDASLGGMPGWAGFELMAQTISALLGLVIREKGLPPRPGVILSITKMEIALPVLREGKTVTINVREDAGAETISSYDCSLFMDGGLASGARITVMDVDDLSVFKD